MEDKLGPRRTTRERQDEVSITPNRDCMRSLRRGSLTPTLEEQQQRLMEPSRVVFLHGDQRTSVVHRWWRGVRSAAPLPMLTPPFYFQVLSPVNKES